MIAPPTFCTDRLVLEPLGPRHSAGMFLLWSREEVCRYSGPVQDWNGNAIALPVTSVADSDKIIDFFEHKAAEDDGFRWALVRSEGHEFAGTVGFNRLRPTPELAFHMRPELWGKGLMREAAEAALAWSRRSGARSVEAFIEPGNRASITLARRLGFVPTGVMQEGAERFLLAF